MIVGICCAGMLVRYFAAYQTGQFDYTGDKIVEDIACMAADVVVILIGVFALFVKKKQEPPVRTPNPTTSVGPDPQRGSF